MITLDEIHEYHPPAQSSSKASQSSKPSPTSIPPPLTHPLPQRPTPIPTAPGRIANSHPAPVHHGQNLPFFKGDCDSSQVNNAFDRELATLHVPGLSDPTLIDVDRNGYDRQADTVESSLSRRGFASSRDGEPSASQIVRMVSPCDQGQRQTPLAELTEVDLHGSARAVCPSNNGLDVFSGSGQTKSMSATKNRELRPKPTVDTKQPVTTDIPDDTATDSKNRIHAIDFAYTPITTIAIPFTGSVVMTPPAGHNSLDSTNSTQSVSEVIEELPVDQAVGGVVPKILDSDTDAVLMTQDKDNDSNRDQTPCHSNQIAAAADPHHMQGQSTSAQNQGTDLQSDGSVEVTIPAPQPTKSRGSTTATRPHRTGHGKRKNRSTSPQESDDTDDDDYVATRTTQDDLRRLMKKTKRLTATGSNRPTNQTATRSPLDGFSLPDLHAVSQAVLTVEFFPSKIMYSFSWKKNKDAPDHLAYKEKLIVPTDQGCTNYEKTNAQSSAAPAIIHKTTKAHTPFSQKKLDLLKQLKKED